LNDVLGIICFPAAQLPPRHQPAGIRRLIIENETGATGSGTRPAFAP
jgi:hypothetical protein